MTWPVVAKHRSAQTSKTAIQLAFWLPWVALGVTMAAVVIGGTPSREIQLLPFAASVVLFGLPHGAVDHLTPPWARDEPPSWRWFGIVGGLYFVVGLAYGVVWFLAPLAAFVFFILLTWFHWGQGELYPLLRVANARHLGSRASRILTLVVRGSLPMVVPLVAFPGEYRWVAEQLIGLFATPEWGVFAVVFTPAGRTAVAAGLGVLFVFSLAVSYLHTPSRRSWSIDAGEVVFLSLFFLTVPPLLAVGIYFCFWHAMRHIVRLMLLDETAAARLAEGSMGGALGRFGWVAAPLTVVSLGVFVALGLTAPAFSADYSGVFALYLVGIAVMTAPHVVIVTWLDLEESIWTV